jgi:acyl-CoA synthetase (NDP forming)
MSEKNTVALNERDSSSLLSSCGVRMVASVLLDKPDRAAFEAASRQLGFPVAMKVLSDDILHKTDVGCVVLNVTDVDGMQAAYDTIMANAAKNAPGARVQGVLAQQMLPKGFEVLLGVSTDPQFGHVIMAGRRAGGAAARGVPACAAYHPPGCRGYDR